MPKIIALGDLADIGLGYKSLQNDFFYVSPETIATYGIEERFLHPIFKMKDFDGARYLQSPAPSLFVFTCRDDEVDLKGTGALKYIRVMAGRSANSKKQAAGGETISQALGKQGGKHWYAPKAARNPSRIWMRKAFGGVFAPFICEEPIVADQRCNFCLPKPGLTSDELAALLTSSVLAYSIEVNGSISMGAGVLEAPTSKIRDYPAPDVAEWSAKDRTELCKLARKVWMQELPVDWVTGQRPGPHLSELDEFVLNRMPGEVTVSDLHRDLASTAQARVRLATGKTGTQAKKKAESLQSVSKAVVAAVRGVLEVKPYPEGFFGDSEPRDGFDSVGRRVTSIDVYPMMGETDLVIGLENELEPIRLSLADPVAQVITRALLLGRTRFEFPTERSTAQAVVSTSETWLRDLAIRLEEAVSFSAAGSGYEESVKREALGILGIHPEAFMSPLPLKMAFDV